MAPRFDNVADFFSRTTGLLDYNAAYTFVVDVYFVSGTGGTYMTVIAMDNGASFTHSDEIGVDDAGSFRFIVISNNNFSFVAAQSSTTPVNSTWYRLCLRRRSVTALDLFVNETLEATSAGDVTGRAASTEMLAAAGYGGGNNNINGRVVPLKAWSTNLSDAEVVAEMRQITPVRWTNLYGFWPTPFGADRINDYSGNGRNWTSNGTITDEDGPPIAWGPPLTPNKQIPMRALPHIRM
jgi:hypothetical protein